MIEAVLLDAELLYDPTDEHSARCVDVMVLPDGKSSVSLMRDICANVIIRGVRNQLDFELEMTLAAANRHMSPSVETILLPYGGTKPWISSTVVKEMARLGAPIGDLVPSVVAAEMYTKLEVR